MISVNWQKNKKVRKLNSEISIVHKDLIPEQKLKGGSSIYLQRLFEEAIKLPLVKAPIAIPQSRQSSVINQKVLYVATDNY